MLGECEKKFEVLVLADRGLSACVSLCVISSFPGALDACVCFFACVFVLAVCV